MGWGKEVVSLIDLLVNLFLVPLGSVAFVCSQSLPFDMGKELWPKFPPSSCTSTSAAQGWGGRGRPSPYICVVIQDSRLPPLPAPLLPLPLLFLLLGSPAQEEEEVEEASILVATGVVVGEEKEETSRGRM